MNNDQQQSEGSLKSLILGTTPQGMLGRAAVVATPFAIGKYNNMRVTGELDKVKTGLKKKLPKKPKFLTAKNLGKVGLGVATSAAGTFIANEAYRLYREKNKKWWEL